MTNAPPGWYANGVDLESWWDGERWHDVHRPVNSTVSPTPVAEYAPPNASQLSNSGVPALLLGDGINLERGSSGLKLVGVSRLGRYTIGGEQKHIPYEDLLTVELVSSGIRLRAGKHPVTVPIGRSNREAARRFVEALLEQHRTTTSQTIGSGERLSRAAKAALIETGVQRAFEARIPNLREVIRSGDIEAEGRQTIELKRWAREQGMRSWEEHVDQAAAKMREELDLNPLVLIGRLGSIRVYEDRLVDGGEAHPIDAFTEAQVYLDGQIQVTTRPSMGAALVTSILPGTALIGAMAFGKEKRHDSRVASFQVGSTNWTWSGSVPPQTISYPRALAQRINAIASALQDAAVARPPAPDQLTQLERIAALEQSGALSAEQAIAMRSKVIAES